MSKIAGRTRLAYGGGRRYQTGLGALGWLIVLAIASFALTCFFRVGPVYLDYWNTKQSLDVVMQDGKTPSLSKTELQRAIATAWPFKEELDARERLVREAGELQLVSGLPIVLLKREERAAYSASAR